jgi:hypothetical protein
LLRREGYTGFSATDGSCGLAKHRNARPRRRRNQLAN